MGMLDVRNNPKRCHPERSTMASEASCRAQSKDPYAAGTLFRAWQGILSVQLVVRS